MKKNFIKNLKEKLPNIKNRFLKVIDLFFVYQIILFILNPTKIMGIFLIIIFIIYALYEGELV